MEIRRQLAAVTRREGWSLVEPPCFVLIFLMFVRDTQGSLVTPESRTGTFSQPGQPGLVRLISHLSLNVTAQQFSYQFYLMKVAAAVLPLAR